MIQLCQKMMLLNLLITQEEYDKKNARLDERIAGLKEAEKRAKADATGKKTAQTTGTGKSAKTAEKPVKNGADTTTPKVAKEPQATPKTEPKEAKLTAVAESKALAVIPKSQPTTATVAQAV